MSECEHNNHSHTTLWIAVLATMLGWCNHCNSELERVRSDSADLQRRVNELESRPR